MHSIAVPVTSPLNLGLPQALSTLLCSAAYCFAVLDATTIRCCDGIVTEPALLGIAATTVGYHAVIMLVESYLRLWAPNPPPKREGIQLPTVYSHLACLITTFLIWLYWIILLPLHATGYESVMPIYGQHYFTPMLVLEGLEVGALAWLWWQSVAERSKARKVMLSEVRNTLPWNSDGGRSSTLVRNAEDVE